MVIWSLRKRTSCQSPRQSVPPKTVRNESCECDSYDRRWLVCSRVLHGPRWDVEWKKGRRRKKKKQVACADHPVLSRMRMMTMCCSSWMTMMRIPGRTIRGLYV